MLFLVLSDCGGGTSATHSWRSNIQKLGHLLNRLEFEVPGCTSYLKRLVFAKFEVPYVCWAY